VQQELRQRYLTAVVTSVDNARQEYGATYWNVQSDRGPREFITQNLQETALWLSDDHLLLLDVDGSRFEIPSVSALDVRSRQFTRKHLVISCFTQWRKDRGSFMQSTFVLCAFCAMSLCVFGLREQKSLSKERYIVLLTSPNSLKPNALFCGRHVPVAASC
jgi:hypothetical protein